MTSLYFSLKLIFGLAPRSATFAIDIHVYKLCYWIETLYVGFFDFPLPLHFFFVLKIPVILFIELLFFCPREAILLTMFMLRLINFTAEGLFEIPQDTLYSLFSITFSVLNFCLNILYLTVHLLRFVALKGDLLQRFQDFLDYGSFFTEGK